MESRLPLDTSPTVLLTTPSPSLPDSSTTIIKTESFKTAAPFVSGIETLIISYGWEHDSLTVAIAANTKIELEVDPYNKVTGSVGASVYVDNIEYKIYLKHPDHPVMIALNSTQQEGQTTIFNVQEGAQVTLKITIAIRTNGGLDQTSAASFTQPFEGIWKYVINR